ncbi:hypothetical protein GCM10027297_04320 [Parahaliea aestuarii]
MDDLVTETLAAAAHGIADTGGADTDTGGFDGGVEHRKRLAWDGQQRLAVYGIDPMNARYKRLINLIVSETRL